MEGSWKRDDVGDATAAGSDGGDAFGRLDVGVPLADVRHPLARDVIGRLQTLRRGVDGTTPYDVLSQAVDMFRVRATLQRRHGGHAERALANVDLYLGMSRPFAVRGPGAFAAAMSAAWSDEDRAAEGRPDAQEEAVALSTMHAAKGLEWPIVVPINTMTQIKAMESVVVDAATERLLCPVFGAEPSGYREARRAETEERERERVRLWYVAATRAREVLVIPRLNVASAKATWISLVDLSLEDLPALDLSHLPSHPGAGEAEVENAQTRSIFGAEAAAIAAKAHRLAWSAPSRDENVRPYCRSSRHRSSRCWPPMPPKRLRSIRRDRSKVVASADW